MHYQFDSIINNWVTSYHANERRPQVSYRHHPCRRDGSDCRLRGGSVMISGGSDDNQVLNASAELFLPM
jgi:hypothetical protein